MATPGKPTYIECMDRWIGRIRSYRKALAGVSIACAALAAAIMPAAAVDIGPAGGGPVLIIPNAGADIRAMENRIRRQQFQQQQQFNREVERLAAPRQAPPEVPRMKPNCQATVYGNAYTNSCR
jgi:hypothetical protein